MSPYPERIVICTNSECTWFEAERVITATPVAPGAYTWPGPAFCECRPDVEMKHVVNGQDEKASS
jgi:hypothetical protein